MSARGRAFLIAGLAVAPVAPLWGHPGVGIVKDHRGVVFYTDLVQIWQIDPDGRRSIAVPNVHSHDLAIDGAGNLIGEEVRQAGGAWQHRIWRRTPDGRLTEVVPWTDGFWQDDGLVSDLAGNRYWVACPERRCLIRRREPNGQVVTLARDTQFRFPVNWLALGPEGAVYFPEGPDLRKLDTTGSVSTVARNLGPPADPNALMGLRVSADGDIHVAVPSRRVVLRVAKDGRSAVAASSPAPWAPSGVLVDTDRSLWILEFDPENRVRVRRIDRNGAATTY